jgi:hypothetical protein
MDLWLDVLCALSIVIKTMSLMAKFLGQPIRANILASDFSMVGLYKKQEISDIFD